MSSIRATVSRRVATFFLLLFCAVFTARDVHAQATASIDGTVTDASGAAVPDAQIQARNTGTGISQTTTTDAQGRYRIPELIIGTYDIQASKAGFSTTLRKGIT